MKLIISLIIILALGSVLVLHHHSPVTTDNLPYTASGSICVSNCETQVTPTSSPPATTPVAPASTGPTQAQADNVVCAGLLKDIISANKDINANYLADWKIWIDSYKNDYTTTYAQDSEQLTKTHYQQEFTDLINSYDPLLQHSHCGSTTTAQLLLQPNYDAWQ